MITWRKMLVLAAILIALLMGWRFAESAELSVSVNEHIKRGNHFGKADGFDLRLYWDSHAQTIGGMDQKYGKWALSIGVVGERDAGGVDSYIDTPAGCCGIAVVPFVEYRYVNLTHLWRASPPRWPNARIHLGLGVAWRDAYTCVDEGCWNGTPGVSSRLTYHLMAKYRYKWVEVSWEHDSTASFSSINKGDDWLRFGFVTPVPF